MTRDEAIRVLKDSINNDIERTPREWEEFDTLLFEAVEMAIKALEDRPKKRWYFVGDNMFQCTSCEVLYTTEQLNNWRNFDSDPYAPRYCPNCGADMKGGSE